MSSSEVPLDLPPLNPAYTRISDAMLVPSAEPVWLTLGSDRERHELAVISPRHYLPREQAELLNPNISHLIIDPHDLNIARGIGFKALHERTPVVLGRESTYDRFTFGSRVSRKHVRFELLGGAALYIKDLDSTDGTFLRKSSQN